MLCIVLQEFFKSAVRPQGLLWICFDPGPSTAGILSTRRPEPQCLLRACMHPTSTTPSRLCHWSCRACGPASILRSPLLGSGCAHKLRAASLQAFATPKLLQLHFGPASSPTRTQLWGMCPRWSLWEPKSSSISASNIQVFPLLTYKIEQGSSFMAGYALSSSVAQGKSSRVHQALEVRPADGLMELLC